MSINIKKRGGYSEPLDISKIQKQTADATFELEGVSQSELEVDAHIQFRDGMSSEEIQKTLISTAVTKTDIDRPNWTFVAARLFIYDLYHKVGKTLSGEKGNPYCHLSKYLEYGEKEGRLFPGLSKKFNIEELNSFIKPERDFLFNYLGIKTLYDRYLIKDTKGNCFELPQQMFMGISMFLAQEETDFNSKELEEEFIKKFNFKNEDYLKEVRTYWAKSFYEVISSHEVMLATPTLSNARTLRHQLSSCYIGSTPDNIEGIFDAYKEMALLSKYGGGIGWDWNQVRGMASYIAGHKGAAGGTVPFLKITNDIAIAVDQLGCVAENTYVEVIDTVETNTGNIHDFRKEYIKIDLNDKEKIEEIAGFASNFAFEYGKYSKNFISSLLYDYIVNAKNLEFLCDIYNLDRNTYKKIIGKYKKINKGLPLGFKILKNYNNYAISKEGIVINLDSLKPLKTIIDRKGYVRVSINKESIALHKLLVKEFVQEDLKGLTIDHKDNNKLNNSLDNFNIISNENNISKSWLDKNSLRTEKIRIKGNISYGKELNGARRTKEEDYVSISKINTKKILIGELRVGDLVKSFNTDLNEIEYKEVLSTYDIVVKKKDQIKLTYKDGSYIVTSKWHPTYVKQGSNEFSYIRADEVSVGDFGLNSLKEMVEIVSIDLNPEYSESYKDLTIKGNNNYFATTDVKNSEMYLIHNTRKGAIAVYLEPWHKDILDFLDLKKNSGEERRRTHDLFPALWINDFFMNRVLKNELLSLFSPDLVPELSELYGDAFEAKYKEYEADLSIPRETIPAQEIWKKALQQYFETGSPFLCFKDTANFANPNGHIGHIRSSNLCVSGDTRLATQFGLVKAKELYESKEKILATYDLRTDGDRLKKGTSIAQCIEMHKTKENAEIFEVQTKDGYKIKSTDWHEYYVNRDNAIVKLKLKDIKIGDKLLIQSEEGQFGKEGSYELGLLTGFIAGDGTFSTKKDKNYSIAHIDLYNEEIKLKDLIKLSLIKVINNDYGTLKNSYKKDLDISIPKEINHTENSKKIRFSSGRLGRILEEKYNFNKDNKLSVPEFIFQGTKETVKGYLQGLFVSDSCIEKIKNNGIPSFVIKLASKERTLLEEVQILLSNFGIRSKIYKSKRENSFKYKTIDGVDKEYFSNDLFLLSINGNNAIKFINNIGLLGIKQEKALKIMKERVSKLGRVESNKQEYFEVEIKNIKFVGTEDVYDTTQLVNHSLIFNGLVTGNCTEIFQNTSPNKYLIKLEFMDGEILTFDENVLVKVDSGLTKQAKTITALDSINGKRIFIVEKEKIDGDTAVCNLGSVNLSKINTKSDIERVVPILTRMLDNVIELNFYPLRKVKATNLKTRAIGLGVMGEAQMLAEKGIIWGTQEHFSFIDEIMEMISFNTIKSSALLSQEKGSYPEFKGSSWNKGIVPIDVSNQFARELVDRNFVYNWDELRSLVSKGMRNGYLMAIAPTSSISILVGTTQAIEPVYKRKWFEENLSGLIPVVAPNLSPDTWNSYVPAYEVDQINVIKAAAIRQKWIDQGQSTNIFLSVDKVNGKLLHQLYVSAWKYGLKSTYYLRSESPDAKKAEMSVADRSVECEGCQ